MAPVIVTDANGVPVTNADGEPVKGATVRVGVNSTETDAEGKYSFDGIQVGEYSFAVTKAGYQAYTATITVEDIENNVVDAVIESKAALDLGKYDTIESEDMIVYLGKEFPVVARYEMKSDETGKTFFRGNETNLNEIVINGKAIVPVMTNAEEAAPAEEAAEVVAESDLENKEEILDTIEHIKEEEEEPFLTHCAVAVTSPAPS